MATVPDAFFKVEQWNSNFGAKAKLETAWFRIAGIPMEKRSVKNVSSVASFVGLPLEVDVNNLKRWDYVRIKIGCRDITKVPAVAEGVLDMHFYDFVFQREVPQEGFTNAAGTTWTRNSDRDTEEHPSSKKQRRGEHSKDREEKEDDTGGNVNNVEDSSRGRQNVGQVERTEITAHAEISQSRLGEKSCTGTKGNDLDNERQSG